jgi:hypothetical protein
LVLEWSILDGVGHPNTGTFENWTYLSVFLNGPLAWTILEMKSHKKHYLLYITVKLSRKIPVRFSNDKDKMAVITI